jgi:uncharacterized protein (DUF3820 family)
MRFGKFKGVPIEEIPASYLLWFNEQPWASSWVEEYQHVLENKAQLLKQKEKEDLEDFLFGLKHDGWGDRV